MADTHGLSPHFRQTIFRDYVRGLGDHGNEPLRAGVDLKRHVAAFDGAQAKLEKPMRIVIETIPHKSQRYPTLGDYWMDADGTAQIRVSDFTGACDTPRLYALLIAFHEMIEQALCLQRGIAEEAITAFDKAHLADDDLWSADPGHCPQAPYHREHVFAECMERLFAAELGVNWQDYEKAIAIVDAATTKSA